MELIEKIFWGSWISLVLCLFSMNNPAVIFLGMTNVGVCIIMGNLLDSK